MANVVQVNTWEECEDKIRQLEASNGSKDQQVLFRGQADAKWPLKTTLERLQSEVDVVKYYRLIMRIRHEIGNYSQRDWKLPSLSTITGWSKDYDKFALKQLPAYSYMVNLRHNGFPSSLLDWTDSPYIAAYFAFAEKTDAINVSIYAYFEAKPGTKVRSSDKPQIFRLGHYVSAHRRHFRQRSIYTYCARWNASGAVFVSHQDVLNERGPRSDSLWKIEIPASERRKVLALLDRFNLNAFSLFDSEESLMQTLAFREIDSKEHSLS